MFKVKKNINGNFFQAKSHIVNFIAIEKENN